MRIYDSWKKKEVGLTIDELMKACGFSTNSLSRKNSEYLASYQAKLLLSNSKTITGWFTETWEVRIDFTELGFSNWDRIGFEHMVSDTYGQNADYSDMYRGEGDKVYIVYNIKILRRRRRK